MYSAFISDLSFQIIYYHYNQRFRHVCALFNPGIILHYHLISLATSIHVHLSLAAPIRSAKLFKSASNTVNKISVICRQQLKLIQFIVVVTTNRQSGECLYPLNGSVLRMVQFHRHMDGGLSCLFTVRGGEDSFIASWISPLQISVDQ